MNSLSLSALSRGGNESDSSLSGLLQGSIKSATEVIFLSQLSIREHVIQDLESSLFTVGTCEEHRKKITILLRLIDLCTEETHGDGVRQAREVYFYRAVMIAIQYLGERLWEDDLGKALFSVYLMYIATWITPFHLSEPRVTRLFYIEIEQECAKRRSLLLEEAADTETYLSGITDYSEIIERIEKVLGPIRLLIVSEESGEVFTIHRMDYQEVGSVRKTSRELEYTLEVSIFDKPRKYRVIIDHGTLELMNQIKLAHIENIINPILRHYIEQKEYAFTSYATDYRNITRQAESTMNVPAQPNRYDDFIRTIMGGTSDTSISTEIQEDPEYLKECLQAIDISRILTLKRTTYLSQIDLIQDIDRILGGQITRRVLDMARAILISRSEMMNGSGYPFGLSKKNIPLEARIHTIIRSYESLCQREKDMGAVYARLHEWNQGGYLDAHMLALFMKFLKKASPMDRSIQNDTSSGVTAYRKKYYTDFIHSYYALADLIDQIEDIYSQFRNAGDNRSERNRLALISNELQARLILKAEFSKIFFVTGHGQTLSDTIEGQPGSEEEGLTLAGIESSQRKRKIFAQLSVSIYSSPLERAIQTADIIYGARKKSSRIYPGITLVEGLQNPRKDFNHRGTDAVTKLITDQPLRILDFILGSVHSPRDSQKVIIAHGTTNGYMMGILENLGSKDQMRIGSTQIKDDTIEVCLMRGGRRVEWDLLFSFPDWSSILMEIDSVCEYVFGERFNLQKGGKIHLIFLHKKFLDYIDRKNEESPEKVEELLKRLDEGIHTKHFRSVLVGAGFTF